MTLDEFRFEMAAYRLSANEIARSLKQPYVALEKLCALYKKFTEVERRMADHVLGEWALSQDEGLRFDALVLIDDFKIETCLPMLRTLAARLLSSTEPGAPYELEKVRRIINSLEI